MQGHSELEGSCIMLAVREVCRDTGNLREAVYCQLCVRYAETQTSGKLYNVSSA